jgi:exopolysaccharide biosynthesis WecB/TagA/CpsF family protein
MSAMDGSTNELLISDCSLGEFMRVATNFGTQQFGYAVTPNVDHLIRFWEDAAFRTIYRDASFVLFDSRFLAILLRIAGGIRLPICPGSDLTAGLLNSAISSSSSILLIGGRSDQVAFLRRTYDLKDLNHYNPPMGFMKDPTEVESCLQFIENASPFRFCFLAVGSPQQEQLARMLLVRGRVRGLALCVGGAINFLTGAERRAPKWMQKCGLEWTHRLLLDPRRMTKRYLLRGPRIFLLLPRIRFLLRPVLSSDVN